MARVFDGQVLTDQVRVTVQWLCVRNKIVGTVEGLTSMCMCVQSKSEVRIHVSQGIVGHVATTGQCHV